MSKLSQDTKNGNFVQFNRDYMKNIGQISKYGGQTALELFMFICEHMDGYNSLMASYQVFMDYTGKSRVTCSKAINWLLEQGFLDVLKSGTSNVYIINQNVAWTSYANQKKYCKFAGNILVSAAENKDWFYRTHGSRVKKLEPRLESSDGQIKGQLEIKDTDCHIS